MWFICKYNYKINIEPTLKFVYWQIAVTVQLQANNSDITLTIQDSGKEMSENVRQKILAGNRITEGKEKGNGLPAARQQPVNFMSCQLRARGVMLNWWRSLINKSRIRL